MAVCSASGCGTYIRLTAGGGLDHFHGLLEESDDHRVPSCLQADWSPCCVHVLQGAAAWDRVLSMLASLNLADSLANDPREGLNNLHCPPIAIAIFVKGLLSFLE